MLIEKRPWACVTPASTGATYISPWLHISGVMRTCSANGPAGRYSSAGEGDNRTLGASFKRPSLTARSNGEIRSMPSDSLASNSPCPIGKP